MGVALVAGGAGVALMLSDATLFSRRSAPPWAWWQEASTTETTLAQARAAVDAAALGVRDLLAGAAGYVPLSLLFRVALIAVLIQVRCVEQVQTKARELSPPTLRLIDDALTFVAMAHVLSLVAYALAPAAVALLPLATELAALLLAPLIGQLVGHTLARAMAVPLLVLLALQVAVWRTEAVGRLLASALSLGLGWIADLGASSGPPPLRPSFARWSQRVARVVAWLSGRQAPFPPS